MTIPSANYDFTANTGPTTNPAYNHPAATRFGTIPVAFQITSPLNVMEALLPHALVMHVNPANFNETHTKKIERFQTRGGFVEQHWGDELSEVQADGTTSAFINLYTGTSSLLRQQTIAWDRYRDLHDIYRNNGDVYDPYGNIVLKGNVMLMYDKAFYIGYFSSFESEENDGSPFTFALSWTFKVETTVQKIAGVVANNGLGNPFGQNMVGVYPSFQIPAKISNAGPASATSSNAANAPAATSANNALAASALHLQNISTTVNGIGG